MLLILALCAGTVACTPAYNWRENRVPEQGYTVLLPGKPASMTRTINLDGPNVSMTMYGANVEETSFVVGVVKLPGAGPKEMARALDAMQRAMVRNVAGAPVAPASATVTLVDAQGVAAGTMSGQRIETTGRQGERVMHLTGLFVANGERLYQVVAVGERLDAEQTRLFLDSFRLIR